MKTFLSIFLLAGACAGTACRKPEIAPAPFVPTDTVAILNIRWQKPLKSDTSYGATADAQFVFNGQIIYSVNFTLPTATVQARNTETGEINWIFDDFIQPIDGFAESGQVLQARDKTIINAWHRVYCADNASGALTWATDVSVAGGGGPFATMIGDLIYATHYTGPKPNSLHESLVRTHYLDGQWDTLVTFSAEQDFFYPNILPPALWINPAGDSILIIGDRQVLDTHAPLVNGKNKRVHLYAFNLRTRQFDWEKPDFDPSGYISGELPPFVSGDRLYVLGSSIVHCIDLHTGQTLWQRDIPGGCYAGSLVEHNGAVIVQSMTYGMWALDKLTGATVWHNPDTDGAALKLTLFEGTVYFTSTGYALLYAIDAQTGKTLWKTQTPSRLPDASFSFSGLAIDEQRRLLFVADGYFLYCIELPPK